MVAKQQSSKPQKPRPDFPLYAHARGYWCKSYGGTKYNCGPWEDPSAAERKWLEIKSRLDRGEPVNAASQATIKVLCNLYQKEQNRRAGMGDLSPAHAREVRGYCVHLLRHFGPTRELATIRKEDFAAIKSSFPKSVRKNEVLPPNLWVKIDSFILQRGHVLQRASRMVDFLRSGLLRVQ